MHQEKTSPSIIASANRVLVSALAVCICSMASAAEPEKEGGPSSSGWSLGIGAVGKQQAYAGVERKYMALPLIGFENEYFKIGGLGAEFKLPRVNISETQKLEFGIVGKYEGAGYDADDAEILNGMAEREGSIWVGAKAKWRNSFFDLGTELLADASGHSKGYQIGVTLEKTWKWGSHLMLTPRVGASWLDKKYVDYYYGVREQEVRANRAAYVGKAAINGELGLRVMYAFDRHHSAFFDASVTALSKEIKDSPLVDRSTVNRMFIGYMYRF